MARITIVPDDGNLLVDGVVRTVDMTGMDTAIHAVQWFDTVGEIEYTPADGRRNEVITDISPFQVFIDRWTAAAPSPPTLGDIKSGKVQEFIAEGVSRIIVQVPDWDTVQMIKTVAGLWPAISATANPAQLLAKDTYLFVKDTAAPKINAMATAGEVNAVDPALADPFGDGTVWPT